ncbi:hypothetical protein BDR07DRAFT_1480897 [Suillus spraguei]|nr:hypothetical protein BDR07DRAFT_1480897 [Suillus spraguei]
MTNHYVDVDKHNLLLDVGKRDVGEIDTNNSNYKNYRKHDLEEVNNHDTSYKSYRKRDSEEEEVNNNDSTYKDYRKHELEEVNNNDSTYKDYRKHESGEVNNNDTTYKDHRKHKSEEVNNNDSTYKDYRKRVTVTRTPIHSLFVSFTSAFLLWIRTYVLMSLLVRAHILTYLSTLYYACILYFNLTGFYLEYPSLRSPT